MSKKAATVTEEAAHFASISRSYLVAAAIVRGGFPNAEVLSARQTEYLVHPIAQLIGIALETSLKGLLLISGQEPPRTHDLEYLFGKIEDSQIQNKITHSLRDMPVPQSIRRANSQTTLDDLECFYRQPHFHLVSLNSVYNRPFISRYPSRESFMMPDPDALLIISSTALDSLNEKILSATDKS